MKKIILLACVMLEFFSVAMSDPQLVIGIAGDSGSGKTSLANQLKTMFETDRYRVAVISQNWYYHDFSAITFAYRCTMNFDDPITINSKRFANDLSAICAGQIVECPQYNFAKHVPYEELLVFDGSQYDVVIVKGTMVLYFESIRRLCDIRIFLDVSEEVRLARRIKRDIAERGRTEEEVRERFFKDVKPAHDGIVWPSHIHETHRCGGELSLEHIQHLYSQFFYKPA